MPLRKITSLPLSFVSYFVVRKSRYKVICERIPADFYTDRTWIRGRIYTMHSVLSTQYCLCYTWTEQNPLCFKVAMSWDKGYNNDWTHTSCRYKRFMTKQNAYSIWFCSGQHKTYLGQRRNMKESTHKK